MDSIPKNLSTEAQERFKASTPVGEKDPNFVQNRTYYQLGTQEYSDQIKNRYVDKVAERVFNGVRVLEVTPKDYEQNDRVIIYIHGGGWTLGAPDHVSQNFAEIAYRTSCKVIAVDYRLAPEHRFPAGLNDCTAVFTSLVDMGGYDPKNIILMGGSAGGNLALATALKLRNEGKSMPGAVCTISPATDLTMEGDSYDTLEGKDPAISKELSVAPNVKVYTDEENLKNPLVSPLFANFSKGFPTTGIFCGGREVLLSDSWRLAEKMRRSGVDCELNIFEGLWHGIEQENFPQERDRLISSVVRFILKNAASVNNSIPSRL